MEVAKDDLRGDVWVYRDGWYYQTRNAEIISRLSAKNFPDPFSVWEKKIEKNSKIFQRELTNAERQILKPGQYIFDIWKHRNADSNYALQSK